MYVRADFQQIIQRFFELKVIEVSVNSIYRVGEDSCPLFFDLKRVYSDPSLRKKLIKTWVGFLEDLSLLKNRDVVIAGTATAGVIPAFAIAEELQLPFVYANLSPTNFSKREIEGVFSAGTQIILVDDFVATGHTLLDAANIFRKEGAQILFGTSIATRSSCL